MCSYRKTRLWLFICVVVFISVWVTQMMAFFKLTSDIKLSKDDYNLHLHPKQRSFLLTSQEHLPATTVTTTPTSDTTETSSSDKSYDNLLDTPSCFVPNIAPYDSSVLPYVTFIKKLDCGEISPLTYIAGNKIYINTTVRKYDPYKNLQYCIVHLIFRQRNIETDHNIVQFMPASEPFNVSTEIDGEYVKVYCYNGQNKRVYANFHSNIPSNPQLDAELKKDFKAAHGKVYNANTILNVILLGIDSVSRLNFIRQMKKTHSYMKEHLDPVEMKGYTTLGDTTFSNMVPFFTGMKSVRDDIPFDHIVNKTIWQRFRQAGYKTFYAEDSPEVAMWDFLKKGFSKPPTDHYNRHFSIAMYIEENLWSEHGYCVANRPQDVFITDHLLQFLEANRNQATFAISMLTRMSHDFLNHPQTVDHLYAKLLKSLHTKGHLNRSVFLFFSDHGMRYGDFRNTRTGTYEWKLPFMFLMVPNWFKAKYPEIWNNLKTNQRRLSSHYDSHVTLLEILSLNAGDSYQYNATSFANDHAQDQFKGRSWLKPLPVDRTCSDAGIPEYLCTCHDYKPVIKVNSPIILDIVQRLIDVINNNLLKGVIGRCHALELKQVLRADVSSESRIMDKFRLLFKTSPGDAIFEGYAKRNKSEIQLFGKITRTNTYAGQTSCMDVYDTKPYCVCRSDVKLYETDG